MTDINPKTCPAVTILFEGHDHKAAADDFVIQFADGGLDEHVEQMFKNIDRNVSDTDFNAESRTLVLTMAPQEGG